MSRGRPIAEKSQIRIELWVLLILAGRTLVGIGIWLTAFNQAYYFIWFLLILFGLIIIVVGSKLRIAFVQLWEQNDTFRVRRDVLVTDGYIEIRIPSGQTQLGWQDFSGYGEYQGVIILFQGPAISHSFPARFFPE